MSRKRHDDLLGRAGESSTGTRRGGSSGKAVWDTGSSLYDSYELAAVRRLLDRRLLAAGAGILPLATDGTPPAVAAERTGKQRAVVVRARRKKVTLRALFRAVATWAARPRHAPLACACAGMVHAQKSAAVEPDVPSHGEI